MAPPSASSHLVSILSLKNYFFQHPTFDIVVSDITVSDINFCIHGAFYLGFK